MNVVGLCCNFVAEGDSVLFGVRRFASLLELQPACYFYISPTHLTRLWRMTWSPNDKGFLGL
jgi:hypothetical protein